MDSEDKTQVFDASKLTRGATSGVPARSACVIIIAGKNVGTMFRLDNGAPTVLGRANDAAVRLEDDGVSRYHARITKLADGRMQIEDLGSTNGTFCNGVRLQAQILQEGDKLQIGGQSVLRFSFQDAADEDFQKRQYEMATRDAVTGCFNKKYFLERYPTEFSFALRHRKPLCLAMLDIDHFKKINDTHGHPAGDAVLKAVGQLLLEKTRRSDVLARYGGEEFVLLMREIPLRDAHMVTERIRAAVQACRLESANAAIAVTISIGVGYMDESGQFATAESLMQAADTLLYRAKHGGRNRVECNLPPPP